jgi:hypothetical protein
VRLGELESEKRKERGGYRHWAKATQRAARAAGEHAEPPLLYMSPTPVQSSTSSILLPHLHNAQTIFLVLMTASYLSTIL